jgi:outer membrane protein TolC
MILAGCALLGACEDTRDLAPASPATPWQYQSSSQATATPGSAEGAATRSQTQGAATPAPTAGPPPEFTVPPNTAAQLPSPADLEPGHAYSLVELIDVAQRRNPTTRIAWEQARQAAIGVGMARAAYLPVIAASALVGDEYLQFPFPSNLVPKGFIDANIQEAVPQLSISYLLFDFGGRKATLEEAHQGSIAANASFTAAHQQLMFNVARAYFTLDAAGAGVDAAQQALADAQVLQQAAEAQFGRGLATSVSVQIARRGTAQARFDLSQANSARQSALYSLLEAIDLPPTTKLHVVSAAERPLPPSTGRSVEEALNEALLRRPDLAAAVAKLRAADAKVAAVRSESAPKIGLKMAVLGNIARMNTDGGPYFGVARPGGYGLLTLTWTLYDGGLLQDKKRQAQSQRDQAADQLKAQTDQALREVALAYDQVETGLQQYNAAVALQKASEEAFHSATESFGLGVGSLNDAVTAQTSLAQARTSVAQAHAQSLVNAAELAFATGLLTSSTRTNFEPALP